MRIVHLITQLSLGGAQESAALSCLGQSGMGHDVVLAHGPLAKGEPAFYDKIASNGLVRCVEVPNLAEGFSPGSDIHAYWQCRKTIRSIDPDVVHTHGPKAGKLGRRAAWAEGVPAIVHTLHTLPFHDSQPRLRRMLARRTERAAARRCHRIISVAESLKTQALAAKVGKPEQHDVVYSGMDAKSFLDAPKRRDATREELWVDPKHILIGTFARLDEDKGHDDLLTALGPWLLERPDIKMLWIGDGTCREALARRIAAMKLTEQVTLTGVVPHERVAPLMGAMDIVVHAGRREGLPRALPQALMAGVPVVSYDCDGAGEVCIDNKTGRLVPLGNHIALHNAVRWLVDHPKQRRQLGEQGRTLVHKRFDARYMLKKLDGLYQDLLGTA
ncbi:MAG: glycosyltransferase [Phycisphaeraceae bacterium]